MFILHVLLKTVLKPLRHFSTTFLQTAPPKRSACTARQTLTFVQ
jgi:hypothetical protein